jgi:hypothetical protein
LLLVFLTIFFKNSNYSKVFCYLYLFFIFLYWILLPKIFFEYNYSLVDFISSINARFSPPYLNQYSIVNIFLLVFLALVFYFISETQRSHFKLNHLFFLGALALGPLVIHDFSTVIFYWFHIGFLYGVFASDSSKITNLNSRKNA